MQSPPTGPEEPPGGWGTYLPPGVDPRLQAERQSAGGYNDTTAGAALGLGVASVPLYLCCGGFAFILNIVGLVLAIVAFQKAVRGGGRTGNRPIAIAALVVNGLILLVNLGLLGFVAFGAFGGHRMLP